MNEYYNLEAESALIGSILLEQELIFQSKVTPDYFYYDSYRTIFEAMVSLREDNKSIDTVTIAERLGSLIQEVGGFKTLTDIASSVPSVNQFADYEKIVTEKYVMRTGLTMMRDIIKGDHENAESLVAQTRNIVDQLEGKVHQGEGLKHIGESVVAHTMEMADKSEGKVSLGKKTLGVDLTKITGGWQDQDLIIMAARPSVGKTAAMLSDAMTNARDGVVVAIFSLEMPTKTLIDRIVSSESMIDGQLIKKGHLNSEEWIKYTTVASEIAGLEIYIDDRSGLSVNDIRAEVRKLRKKNEDKEIIVYVDYLQLVVSGMKMNNRNDEVGYVSKSFKQMARENKCPVIALAQLSRSVEQRQDKHPINSDLRDSGNIEQDADIIIFLYRDDYYNAETEKKNIVEFIVSKNRNGETGVAELVNLRQYSKFLNYERL